MPPVRCPLKVLLGGGGRLRGPSGCVQTQRHRDGKRYVSPVSGESTPKLRHRIMSLVRTVDRDQPHTALYATEFPPISIILRCGWRLMNTYCVLQRIELPECGWSFLSRGPQQPPPRVTSSRSVPLRPCSISKFNRSSPDSCDFCFVHSLTSSRLSQHPPRLQWLPRPVRAEALYSPPLSQSSLSHPTKANGTRVFLRLPTRLASSRPDPMPCARRQNPRPNSRSSRKRPRLEGCNNWHALTLLPAQRFSTLLMRPVALRSKLAAHDHQPLAGPRRYQHPKRLPRPHLHPAPDRGCQQLFYTWRSSGAIGRRQREAGEAWYDQHRALKRHHGLTLTPRHLPPRCQGPP